jgi:hypothetical protein
LGVSVLPLLLAGAASHVSDPTMMLTGGALYSSLVRVFSATYTPATNSINDGACKYRLIGHLLCNL